MIWSGSLFSKTILIGSGSLFSKTIVIGSGSISGGPSASLKSGGLSQSITNFISFMKIFCKTILVKSCVYVWRLCFFYVINHTLGIWIILRRIHNTYFGKQPQWSCFFLTRTPSCYEPKSTKSKKGTIDRKSQWS